MTVIQTPPGFRGRQVACLRCGRAFLAYPSQIAQGRKKYCSRPCAAAALRKDVLKSYRSLSGGVREHVRIAERALGHSLPSKAEIHHVNLIKWDNHPSNLVICQDHAYHRLLHRRTRIVQAGGDPNIHRICTHCQQLTVAKQRLHKKRFLCRPCYNLARNAWRARRRVEAQICLS